MQSVQDPAALDDEPRQARVMLGLLESVAQDGSKSQRRLASELGIALGLVNIYIKRCVKKGLVKAATAPAGRYAYYLTPQGFAEKSRLTVEYLTSSFSFFREAKASCTAAFEAARGEGLTQLALAGRSDLAEIAAICAIDVGVTVVGIVDDRAAPSRLLGLPVVASFDELAAPFDVVVVTDLTAAQATADAMAARFGADRVLIPDILRARLAPVPIGSA